MPYTQLPDSVRLFFETLRQHPPEMTCRLNLQTKYKGDAMNCAQGTLLNHLLRNGEVRGSWVKSPNAQWLDEFHVEHPTPDDFWWGHHYNPLVYSCANLLTHWLCSVLSITEDQQRFAISNIFGVIPHMNDSVDSDGCHHLSQAEIADICEASVILTLAGESSEVPPSVDSLKNERTRNELIDNARRVLAVTYTPTEDITSTIEGATTCRSPQPSLSHSSAPSSS